MKLELSVMKIYCERVLNRFKKNLVLITSIIDELFSQMESSIEQFVIYTYINIHKYIIL